MRFLMLFLRLVLCAAGRRERYAGQPSPPCPGAHTGAGQLPAGRSRRRFQRARAARHAAAARSVCGSRRGRRRPVALPCALPACLPGPSQPPALPAFSTARRPCAALPLHLKRSIRPGDGSPQNAAAPGTLYRSRGYIYHVLGLCGACRIARILFCRGVFLQLGKKTAHGQSEAG